MSIAIGITRSFYFYVPQPLNRLLCGTQILGHILLCPYVAINLCMCFFFFSFSYSTFSNSDINCRLDSCNRPENTETAESSKMDLSLLLALDVNEVSFETLGNNNWSFATKHLSGAYDSIFDLRALRHAEIWKIV